MSDKISQKSIHYQKFLVLTLNIIFLSIKDLILGLKMRLQFYLMIYMIFMN